MDYSYLTKLQNWYNSYCDGTWEHYYGIKINTLDNPGWSLEIDLSETELENKCFVPIEVNSSDSWMICKVKDRKFYAFGDSSSIEKMIQVFLDWAKTE